MDASIRPPQPKLRVERCSKIKSQEQHWTASRCHRLLRPLLSRIALLRKEALSSPLDRESGPARADTASGKRRGSDISWAHPRKQLRRTYASRARPRLKEPAKPEGDPDNPTFRPARSLQTHRRSKSWGEVPITPLLQKARGRILPTPKNLGGILDFRLSHKAKPSNRGARECLGPLDSNRCSSSVQTQAGSQQKHYDAIYRAFEAVLISTAREPACKTGASSLMDMCLRKVPEYIAGVQAWELDEAEEQGTKSMFGSPDTSMRIYSELEFLGTSRSGWERLRVVARGDAIKAIEDVMYEGLISHDFSMLLVDLCAKFLSAAELEGIGTALAIPLLPGTEVEETEVGCVSQLGLASLWEFAKKTNRFTFLLRQYSTLVIQNQLPVAWFAGPECQRVLSLACWYLARDRGAVEAVCFLTSSILHLAKQSRSSESLQQPPGKEGTVAMRHGPLGYILSIIASMRIATRAGIVDKESQDTANRVASVQTNLSFIIDAAMSSIEHWKGKRDRLGGDLVCLASFLSSPESQSEYVLSRLAHAFQSACSSQAGPRCRSQNHLRQNYDAMVSLISSIVKISGRDGVSVSHERLQGLCDNLKTLDMPPGVTTNVAQASAFLLAQQTNNVRDYIFAERLAGCLAPKLEASSNSDSDGDQTPPLLMEYRWEDSIGEWVTISPKMEKKPDRRRSLRSLKPTSAPLTLPSSKPMDLPSQSSSLVRRVFSRSRSAVEAATVQQDPDPYRRVTARTSCSPDSSANSPSNDINVSSIADNTALKQDEEVDDLADSPHRPARLITSRWVRRGHQDQSISESSEDELG